MIIRINIEAAPKGIALPMNLIPNSSHLLLWEIDERSVKVEFLIATIEIRPKDCLLTVTGIIRLLRGLSLFTSNLFSVYRIFPIKFG